MGSSQIGKSKLRNLQFGKSASRSRSVNIVVSTAIVDVKDQTRFTATSVPTTAEYS